MQTSDSSYFAPMILLSTIGETAPEKHSSFAFTAPWPSTLSYAYPPQENLFWKTREQNPGRCSPSLLPFPLSFPPDGPDIHVFRRQTIWGGNEISERGSHWLEATLQFWGWGVGGCQSGSEAPGLRSQDSLAWPPSITPLPVDPVPNATHN